MVSLRCQCLGNVGKELKLGWVYIGFPLNGVNYFFFKCIEVSIVLKFKTILKEYFL